MRTTAEEREKREESPEIFSTVVIKLSNDMMQS